jgi:hypothetical protein
MSWPPKNTDYCTWKPTKSSMTTIARAMAGLGAGDMPAGRRQAYLDLIAPIETDAERHAMAKMSGCALVARGLLRCYGVDAEQLRRPYVVGRAVSDVVEISEWCGAWAGKDQRPEEGDIVVIGRSPSTHETDEQRRTRLQTWGGGEHVITVLGIEGYSVRTLEGGQTDDGGQCILEKVRSMYVINKTIWLGTRRIASICKTSKLRSTLTMYTAVR